MSVEQKVAALRSRKAEALQGGGPARIENQHKKGKFTARERVELLLDPGSFQEVDALREHECHD